MRFMTDDGRNGPFTTNTYERSRCDSNWTTGIYLPVSRKERRGDYWCRTAQVIPTLRTDQGKHPKNADDVDVLLAEIGGTAGDIESLLLEAIRQLARCRRNTSLPRLFRYCVGELK